MFVLNRRQQLLMHGADGAGAGNGDFNASNWAGQDIRNPTVINRRPANNGAGVGDGQNGQNAQNNSGQNQQNAGGNTNGQNNGTNNNNNTGVNDDLVNNIWKDAKSGGGNNNQNQNQGGDDGNANGGGNNNNNNNANNGNTQQSGGDPAAELQAFFTKNGLGELKLSEQELESFKSGEGVNQVLENINKRMQNTLVTALTSASKLIDTRVKAAVAEANKSSKDYVNGIKLREFLQQNISISKDPALGPIVETVFRRFHEKGDSTEQALANTKEYLKRAYQNLGKEFGPNTNSKQPYGNNSNAGTTDWLKTLKS